MFDEWFAVSYMCQKPVRPTYTRLQRLPSEDRDDLIGLTPSRSGPAGNDRVMWLTIWEVMQRIGHGDPLQLKWYSFVASSVRQVAKIKPWRQRVRAIDIEPLALWRGDNTELEALRAKDARKAARAAAQARRGGRPRARPKAGRPALAQREDEGAGEGEVMGALADGIVDVQELEQDEDAAREDVYCEDDAGDEAEEEGYDAEPHHSDESSFHGEWDIGDIDLDEALLEDVEGVADPPAAGIEGGGEPAPLPPPPPAPAPEVLHPAQFEPRDSFDRAGELITLSMPTGKLKYYYKTKVFVAECNRAEHAIELNALGRPMKCHLTKGATASRCAGRGGQGRPLGLLMAWLCDDSAHMSRHEHVREAPLVYSRAARTQARAALSGMGSPIVAALLAAERAPRDGEETEPESVP